MIEAQDEFGKIYQNLTDARRGISKLDMPLGLQSYLYKQLGDMRMLIENLEEGGF